MVTAKAKFAFVPIRSTHGVAVGHVLSTNGAALYQPGATPQIGVRPFHQGPTALPIGEEAHSTFVVAPRGWSGFSALGFVLPSLPGALPQAGMVAHRWRSIADFARELAHPIACNKPKKMGGKK